MTMLPTNPIICFSLGEDAVSIDNKVDVQSDLHCVIKVIQFQLQYHPHSISVGDQMAESDDTKKAADIKQDSPLTHAGSVIRETVVRTLSNITGKKKREETESPSSPPPNTNLSSGTPGKNLFTSSHSYMFLCKIKKLHFSLELERH